MFDGGELYGSFKSEQPPLEKQQLPLPLPSPQQPPQKKQQETMYYHEEAERAERAPKHIVYHEQGESFFDRIASKRYDILKVISFALIIVLAISIDRVNTFYLTQYVTNSILTGTQELLLRISYPITVIIIIWLIKIL